MTINATELSKDSPPSELSPRSQAFTTCHPERPRRSVATKRESKDPDAVSFCHAASGSSLEYASLRTSPPRIHGFTESAASKTHADYTSAGKRKRSTSPCSPITQLPT